MEREIAPSRAFFRFYAELNDHLRPEEHYATIEKTFYPPCSVKDMIESFGVPHAEVDLVIVNGDSVGFDYTVRDRDRIAIYPMFESIDVAPALRVRPRPLRQPKFVLDVHLGRLAAYLRMLGIDAEYRNTFTDAELVRISAGEYRILLTRDRGVLKHSAITHGYWVRETSSRAQVAEVVRRFDLVGFIRPFTRCMACNGILRPVAKEQVRSQLRPRTAELYDEFHRCIRCGRVYWKGSHHARMRRWMENLVTPPIAEP